MREFYRVVYRLKPGKGGDGAVHFARQPFQRMAPPDGGNGNSGGDIIVNVVGGDGQNYASDLRMLTSRFGGHFSIIKSGVGGKGTHTRGKGARGEDTIINVPKGTLMREVNNSDAQRSIWVDTNHPLVPPGAQFVVARGGTGGRGNYSFNSHRLENQQLVEESQSHPEFVNTLLKQSNIHNPFSWATKGQESADILARRQWSDNEKIQSVDLAFETKLVGDVGLIGLPNAGKSSFMEAVCPGRNPAMKLKENGIGVKSGVGDYAFTTLTARLGSVQIPGLDCKFKITDLPGLIKDASKGKGLGLDFLKHAERCRLLVYMLDCTREDLVGDFRTLKHEVDAYFDNLNYSGYSWQLQSKSHQNYVLILANKCDLIDSGDVSLTPQYQQLSQFCSDQNYALCPVSAKMNINLKDAVQQIYSLLQQSHQREQEHWDQWKQKNEEDGVDLKYVWTTDPSIVRNVGSIKLI
ncbi:hypothetical protein MIR68_007643 [Amoeboaphelidium protococcarum]|nr:hypothetical protein MIR68_007643 [Amoeboaphelidium protococcarum]